MTIIENDGKTMLVRLTADEIEALRRQLDGRGLTGIQQALLTEIHFDLGRLDKEAE